MPMLGELRGRFAACLLCCLGAVALFVPEAARARGTGLIFVSNEKSSTISVLDAETMGAHNE